MFQEVLYVYGISCTARFQRRSGRCARIDATSRLHTTFWWDGLSPQVHRR